MDFATAVAALLQNEGGYANVSGDRGGPTRYGICQSVARRDGYDGDMRALPLETARSIYRRRYWDAISLDAFPDRTAVAMFDCAVHMGPLTAIRLLQDTVGVPVDGIVGPVTLAAVRARRDSALAHDLNARRADRYRAIIRNDPSQMKFLDGWLARCAP